VAAFQADILKIWRRARIALLRVHPDDKSRTFGRADTILVAFFLINGNRIHCSLPLIALSPAYARSYASVKTAEI
jgi:hypothetical protein